MRKRQTLRERTYLAVGNQRLVWDGMDSAGAPVPTGIYLWRLQGSRGAEQQGRLVITR